MVRDPARDGHGWARIPDRPACRVAFHGRLVPSFPEFNGAVPLGVDNIWHGGRRRRGAGFLVRAVRGVGNGLDYRGRLLCRHPVARPVAAMVGKTPTARRGFFSYVMGTVLY